MNHIEHEIQSAGVKKCRDLIPICRTNLYSIPNGGKRSKKTAADLKAEGLLAGVWDLRLAVTRLTGWDVSDRSAGLYIEVKTPAAYERKNHGLTPEQVAFRDNVEPQGYVFRIVKSADELFDAVREYLDV